MNIETGRARASRVASAGNVKNRLASLVPGGEMERGKQSLA